jgi:hypothetical protein
MAAFALPARRGDFLYASALLANPGGNTPQKATSTKRKRADVPNASPVSTPRKATKVKSESTPKSRPKKEIATTPSRNRFKNEHIPP